MGFVRETLLRQIAELVGAQVEDRDRLVGVVLLGSVTIVQERSVVLVGAERDGRSEAVERSQLAGHGTDQVLAGWQQDMAQLHLALREEQAQRHHSEEQEKKRRRLPQEFPPETVKP